MARVGATTRGAHRARKTDPGLRVRHALGLLSALVLLADASGSAQVPLPGGLARNGETERTTPCGEVDCGGQASWLDDVVGVVVSAAGQRFAKPGPTDG